MRRSAARWLTCLAVLSAGGCASVSAAHARQQRLESALDALRYPQPREQVWQEVRLLLAERRYPLAGSDAEAVGQTPGVLEGLLSPAKETRPYEPDTGLVQLLGLGPRAPRSEGSVSLDTGWSRKPGDRYHVDGVTTPEGLRVIFTRIEYDTASNKEFRSRDLEMELALARRVDPAAASRVDMQVGDARAP